MGNDHPHYVRPEDRARLNDPTVFHREPLRLVAPSDDNDAYQRLREALTAIPEPTRWRRVKFALGDAWWRVREALHTVRLYP